MKKINMSPFNVQVRLPDGTLKDINYAFKDSIVEILFNPNLKLNTVNLLKQEILAKKIIEAKDELFLEEEEYNRLKHALEIIEGLGRNDIEMVHRVMEAETVEISPKV